MEVVRTLELKNKPKFKVVHIAKTEVRAKDNFSTLNVKLINLVLSQMLLRRPASFCNVKGHSMYKCKKFCTYNSRASRC